MSGVGFPLTSFPDFTRRRFRSASPFAYLTGVAKPDFACLVDSESGEHAWAFFFGFNQRFGGGPEGRGTCVV
jgi:hypothetical protein